jgi:hypothetical protein
MSGFDEFGAISSGAIGRGELMAELFESTALNGMVLRN